MDTSHYNQINKYLGLLLNLDYLSVEIISSNITLIWLKLILNNYVYLNIYERQF